MGTNDYWPGKYRRLPTHADRVAARQAINGQPNGYEPMTEAQLSLTRLSAAADEGRCEPNNPVPGSEWQRTPPPTIGAVDEYDAVQLLQAMIQHMHELLDSAEKLEQALTAYRNGDRNITKLQAVYADVITPELRTRLHIETLANTISV